MTASWYCVLLVTCGLNIALAKDELNFDKWLDEYGYAAESVDYETWKANMQYVVAHNQQESSFKVTLNKFAHLTPKDIVGRIELGKHHYYAEDNSLLSSINDPVPASVDWRTKHMVTPVISLDQVTSAHAYTAADAVSSYLGIQTNNLVVGSATEIVDCCHYHPCSGPLVEDAFTCIHDIGGLCSEDTYKSDVKCACRNSSCTPFGTIKGGKLVPKGDEKALAAAVAMQPIQVFIDASHSSFQLYASGVYNSPECTTTRLDHSMLLVGYGTTQSGMAYWILKNTWGTNWGMDGYMWMAKNKGNKCGIATQANYPY